MHRVCISIVVLALSASGATANVCAGRGNGDQVANPADCGSYYVCDYGNPSLFKCGASLLYDATLGVCNWPNRVACGQLQPVPQPQPNPSPPQAAPAPAPAPPAPQSQKPPPPEHNAFPHWPTFQPNHDTDQVYIDDDYYPGIKRNPNNPAGYQCTLDGFYFVPHPLVCERYFICENRRIHFHQCGNGIHWDFIHLQCDHPGHAFCYAKGTATDRNPHNQQPVNSAPVPSGPNVVSGVPIAIELPALPFVPGTPEPTSSTTSTTSTTTTTTPVPTTTTTTTTTPVPTTTTSTTTTTRAPTTTTTTTTTSAPNTPPTPPAYYESIEDESEELTCPPDMPFMAHTDCHKYYICIASLPIAISCPDKMAWDRTQMQCTEEALVVCEHRPHYYY